MCSNYSTGSISVQDLSGLIKVSGYRAKCTLHPSRSHSRPEWHSVGISFAIFIYFIWLFINRWNELHIHNTFHPLGQRQRKKTALKGWNESNILGCCITHDTTLQLKKCIELCLPWKQTGIILQSCQRSRQCREDWQKWTQVQNGAHNENNEGEAGVAEHHWYECVEKGQPVDNRQSHSLLW